MFDSIIVYPIALAIGLAVGLAVRPTGWRRTLLTISVAGGLAAAIGALEFSRYFSAGGFAEVALMVALASFWCFAFTVVGFGLGAGVRGFLARTIRAFRGN